MGRTRGTVAVSVALMFVVLVLLMTADNLSAAEDDIDVRDYLGSFPSLTRGDSAGVFMDLEGDEAYDALRDAALRTEDALKAYLELEGESGKWDEGSHGTMALSKLFAVLGESLTLDEALTAILGGRTSSSADVVCSCTAAMAIQGTVVEANASGYKLLFDIGFTCSLEYTVSFNGEDVETSGFADGAYPTTSRQTDMTCDYTVVVELTSDKVPHSVSIVSGTEARDAQSVNYSYNQYADSYKALSEDATSVQEVLAGTKTIIAVTDETVKNLSVKKINSALNGTKVDDEIVLTSFTETMALGGASSARFGQTAFTVSDLFSEGCADAIKKVDDANDGIGAMIDGGDCAEAWMDFVNGTIPSVDTIRAVMEASGSDVEYDRDAEFQYVAIAQGASDAVKALKDHLWDNSRTAGYYLMNGSSNVHENVKATVESVLKRCDVDPGSKIEFDVFTEDYIGALGATISIDGTVARVSSTEGSTSVIVPSFVCGEKVNGTLFDSKSHTVKTLTLPVSVKKLEASNYYTYINAYPELTTIVAPGLKSISNGLLDESQLTVVASEAYIAYSPEKRTVTSDGKTVEAPYPINVVWFRYDGASIAGFKDLSYAHGTITGTAVPQSGRTITGISVKMGDDKIRATSEDPEFSFKALANTVYILSATFEIKTDVVEVDTGGSESVTSTVVKDGYTVKEVVTIHLDGTRDTVTTTTGSDGRMEISVVKKGADGKVTSEYRTKGSTEDNRTLILTGEGTSRIVEATIESTSKITLYDIEAVIEQKARLDSDAKVGLAIIIDATGSLTGPTVIAESAIEKASEGKIGMTVEMYNGSIFMSPEVCAKLAGYVGDLHISVESLSAVDLTDAQMEAAKGKVIYDFNVLVGGETPSDYGGLLEFEVEYLLGREESPDNVVVEFIADDGRIESVKAEYDKATSTVTVYAPHCSVYLISSSPSGTIVDGLLLLVIVIATVSIVILTLVYIFRDRLLHAGIFY